MPSPHCPPFSCFIRHPIFDEDLSAPLSEEEIHTAISKLRSGRAPGLDATTSEMLSLGGDVAARLLKAIFNTTWATGSVPEDWQSQRLVPLHKEGSETICDNYRYCFPEYTR